MLVVAVPGFAANDSACTSVFENLLGPVGRSVITGNGALTVGVDASGDVSFCRWPSPGYCNQVNQAAWGLQTPDQLVWLNDPGWQLIAPPQPTTRGIVIERRYPAMGLTCTEEIAVHPEKNLLASRVTVHGFVSISTFLWASQYVPHLRIIPGVPIDDLLGPAFNRTASFVSDQAMYSYWVKPGDADTTANEGVWIATVSPNAIGAFYAKMNTLELVPEAASDGTYTATILIAFGTTKNEVDAILADARADSYEAVAQDADRYWQAWLAQANSASPIHDDLLTLAQCTDRLSGAVIGSPARSWTALDGVAEGAWTTLALDMAGYYEMAEKHTLFYAGLVRRQDKPGRPYGSIPGAVYADGTDGWPQHILQSDATAWMLASFWRHATFLSNTEQQAYLERIWTSVVPAMQFLTAWTDGRNREPFFSFDPAVCRDTQSVHLLLTHYMGVDAALRIAGQLKKNPPERWKQRKTALDILIRFHCVDVEGKWKVADILPFWAQEFAEARLPSWDAILEDQLAKQPVPNAKLLADAAVVWKNNPGRLEQLRPFIETATSQACVSRDSRAAADRVIAFITVHPKESDPASGKP